MKKIVQIASLVCICLLIELNVVYSAEQLYTVDNTFSVCAGGFDTVVYRNAMNCSPIHTSYRTVTFIINNPYLRATVELGDPGPGGGKPQPPPPITPKIAVTALTATTSDVYSYLPYYAYSQYDYASLPLAQMPHSVYKAIGSDSWIIYKPLDPYFIKGSNFTLLGIKYGSDKKILVIGNTKNCHAVYGGSLTDPVFGYCDYISFIADEWGMATFQVKKYGDANYVTCSVYVGPDFDIPNIYSETGVIDKTKINKIMVSFNPSFGITVNKFLVNCDPNSNNGYCFPYFRNDLAGPTWNYLGLNPGCGYIWVDIGVELSKNGISKIFQKRYTGFVLKDAPSEESAPSGDFKIFPNPANENLSVVVTDSKIASINLLDVSGRLLLNESINDTHIEIPTSCYSDGIYFIKVQLEGKSITKKVLIQH